MAKETKSRYEWLPQMMPGVASLIKEKRLEFGSEHVNLCWRKGVLEGVSGWFFAREGSIAIGTTSTVGEYEHSLLDEFEGSCLLTMRNPEGV